MIHGILGKQRVLRVGAALAVLTGVTIGSAVAHAQTDERDDSLGDAASCVTVDFGDARLIVGGPDRTVANAVDLPAGEISIPSARATDGYESRGSVIQNSEKWELEFLAADGSVIATSAPTGDVPDELVFAEWVGSLGTVTLAEPAVAVRAHHRPDLPGDNSPQSVRANEVTFCFDTSAPPAAPTCDDPDVTTNPDGTPCDPAPTCDDPDVTTNPDGTPCDDSSTVTTTEGEVAGPTTTEDASGSTTTAAPTTATTAPAEEVAGPTQLASTGSSTALLVALGSMIVAVGGALILTRRRLGA